MCRPIVITSGYNSCTFMLIFNIIHQLLLFPQVLIIPNIEHQNVIPRLLSNFYLSPCVVVSQNYTAHFRSIIPNWNWTKRINKWLVGSPLALHHHNDIIMMTSSWWHHKYCWIALLWQLPSSSLSPSYHYPSQAIALALTPVETLIQYWSVTVLMSWWWCISSNIPKNGSSVS